MAAEKHCQIDWCKNENSYPLFGRTSYGGTSLLMQSSPDCTSKNGYREADKNGLFHYQSHEINNNSDKMSEMESHVLKILSNIDQCTFIDIQKRLPAVTSPNVVKHTLDSLVSKGLVQFLNSNPQTWSLFPKHQSDEDRNGMTHLYGRGRSLSDRSFFKNCLQNEEQQHQETGNIVINRSLSSPSFQNGSYTFFKQRKISEPTRDASKRCRPRVSSVSEEESNGELIYGLKMHSFDVDPVGGLSKHFSFNSFDLTKRQDHGVGLGKYPSENGRNTHLQKERSPFSYFKPKRDPGVIGGERTKRHNPRSKSLEETGMHKNHLNSSHCNGYNGETRPRSRSFGPDGDAKSCSLCKIPFTSKQQLEEHFQSTKHQNKIAKVTSDPYSKFCDYCKVGLNSKSQAQEHFSSARHEQTVAKSQKAPIRNHMPIDTGSEVFHNLTVTQPQDYQLELYIKAMCSNSVCFLPTGAGNNLVAALVIANILHLNPTRQVIFLVDRVLLVIQQSDYLKHELKNMEVPMSAKDDDQMTAPRFTGQHKHQGFYRPVRIGAICGEMRKLEPGIPIFGHDILVVTADCYRNHISNGTLRFEDSALIVLDESHHCNKDHPYNVIIRDYYLPDLIPLYDRPKILGLTGSPAGEPTLDRTVKKIQRLLSNLGGATLLPVSHQIQELVEKTSQSDIVCHRVDYTPNEKVLLGVLMEYATKCFNLAARVSEFKEYKDVFQPSSGGVLSKEDIGPVLEVIDKFSILSKPRNKSFNSLLHFQTICEAICALQECGEKLAVDRMMELVNCSYGFEWAMEQGLPCEELKSYIETCSSEGNLIL